MSRYFVIETKYHLLKYGVYDSFRVHIPNDL
jgi:hypothetical protein